MRTASLLLFLLAGSAWAADAAVPHEHTGLVTPYTGAPPAVSLSAEDLATLQAGKMVMKQVQRGNGGHAVAFQDIHAAPTTIWSKITNYGMYSSWVNGVKSCSVYKRDGSKIFAQFDLSVMGIGVTYFIKHDYQPASNYLTWTLDYSRQSDLDDSVGYWRLTPLSANPPLTRLEYSVDIRFKGWIPGFVQDFIANKGLSDAVGWVKKQSEAG